LEAPLLVRNVAGKMKKVSRDPLGKWLGSYPEKTRYETQELVETGFDYV